MEGNQSITDSMFGKLKNQVANWFDNKNRWFDMKVLFKDHIKNASSLHDCSDTMDFLNLLFDNGYLSKNNVTILYDTICITKQFGLEQELRDQLPSLHIPNLCNHVITKFSSHRQRLVKLGMVLTKADLDQISGLHNLKKYENSWSLILDLERKRIIHKDKMEDFIKKLRYLQLHDAVEALTAGAGISLTLKRKRRSTDIEEPPRKNLAVEQPPDMEVVNIVEHYLINDYDGAVTKLTLEYNQVGLSECNKVTILFQSNGIQVEVTENKCLVFHLFTYNPNAFRRLWEMHQSGKLLKDLAEILVAEEHLQDFTERWMTWIDETEYKTALSTLERKALMVSTMTSSTQTSQEEFEKLSMEIIQKLDVVPPQGSKGISDEEFKALVLSMSEWYDHQGYLCKLKILYRDLVTEPEQLYAATKVIELFELLCSSGHLSSTDLTVLYDTVKMTKTFHFKKEIQELVQMQSNVWTDQISTFTSGRQKLMALIESIDDKNFMKVTQDLDLDKWQFFMYMEKEKKEYMDNLIMGLMKTDVGRRQASASSFTGI